MSYKLAKSAVSRIECIPPRMDARDEEEEEKEEGAGEQAAY